MARIAVVCPELMFASKVEATLGAAGHEVVPAPSLEAIEAAGSQPALVIADLGAVDAARLSKLAPPALGFYSHVDVDTRRRAEDEGIELVVPRSRMAREMPQLVESLISP